MTINTYKSFTFDGEQGTLDRFGFIGWAGMGFTIDAASPALRAAAEAGEVRSLQAD